MKKDIFDDNSNPFTVPDGYFDTLQGRIMSRIQAEGNRLKSEKRVVRMAPFRWLIAAAACVLLIFTVAALYSTHKDKQSLAAEAAIDEDFFRWLYVSDEYTWLAKSLEMNIPENLSGYETYSSEDHEAIIQFLERDNLSVAAILYSFDNVT